jgi:hypothetical protein
VAKLIVAPQGVSRVLAFPHLVGQSTNRDRSNFAKIARLSKTASCIRHRGAPHESFCWASFLTNYEQTGSYSGPESGWGKCRAIRRNLYLMPCSGSGVVTQSPAVLNWTAGYFSFLGGWLLIRSASATNRLISRRSVLLRSGSFAVFSSEVIASSCRCYFGEIYADLLSAGSSIPYSSAERSSEIIEAWLSIKG